MAIGLSPDINLHWHASDGVSPAVDYKLYTYDQQTSALTETYSEYTGTTPHSNPIILGTDGKVPGEGLWLDSDVVYTFVLLDEDGNSVDTVEGVSISGSVGATGADGADGSTWLFGDGIPAATLGEDSDYYINNEDGTYYYKDDGSWSYVGSLGAPQSQSDWNETDPTSDAYIKNKPRIISDDEIAKLENVPDDTNAELESKIDSTEKGATNGVATLDGTGKVPSSQLSGTVASIQEAYAVSFPPFESDWLSETDGGTALTPSDSVIYYILSSGEYENKEYRWGGTYYVELSESLVLGNTSSTAFQGDWGEVAWEHSQIIDGSNPHNTTAAGLGLGNVDNTSDANKPISSATQTALTALDDSVVHTTGDESVSGQKYFSDRITMHDGLLMDSYQLPSGGSTPEVGQVLRFPTSGNILEWADAAGEVESAESLTINMHGTTNIPNRTTVGTDAIAVSTDNGFPMLDVFVADDFETFDKATGEFTVPDDGQYVVSTMLGAALTDTSTITSFCDLYVAGMPEASWARVILSPSDNYKSSGGTKVLNTVREAASTVVTLTAGVTYTLTLNRSGWSTAYDSSDSNSFNVMDVSLQVMKYNIVGETSASGVGEAPSDGNQYARQDGAWSEIEIPVVNNYWTKDNSGSLPVLRATNGIDWTGANVLELNTGLEYAPTHKEGIIYFDKASRSPQVDMEDTGVHLSLGREHMVRVYDGIGNVSDGDVVYLDSGVVTSEDESVFTVGLAKADTNATCSFIGVATQDIVSGGYGEVTTRGKVRGLDTSSFTNGDVVYVSSTSAGMLTNVSPVFPNYQAIVGKVLKVDATDGVIYVDPDLEPQIAETSSITPPTISLVNSGSITSTFGLLYRSANSNNKPSYRDSQSSQFDNGDCDPIISLGGIVRGVTLTSASMAVGEATAGTTVSARLEMYSIKTSTQGGPTLLASFDIPVGATGDLGIYNNTGSTPGITGSLTTNISVPSGTLLGFQLKNSAAFSGGNTFINAWRSTVVGISIY